MDRLKNSIDQIKEKLKEYNSIDDEQTEKFNSMLDKITNGINNIVVNINTSIKLMYDTNPKNEEIKKNINEVITKVEKMSNILNDLITDLQNEIKKLN